MSETAWPTEWLRGVLELCVLRIVADGPTYGYAIASALAEAGLGTVRGGTLYPILARLEAAGLVMTHWQAGDGGPGRKFYDLSPSGRRHLADRTADWEAFTALTRRLLATDNVPVRQGDPS
ncbi:MAG: PadR family transcriptional regulator [Dermatophilaceae bacterium]